MSIVDAEILSPEQLELFMSDVQVREQRRQARLAKIPLPQEPLRGKKRAWAFPSTPPPPGVVPTEAVHQLGHLLKRRLPLVDEITKYYGIRPTPDNVAVYIEGANANNKTLERAETAEEKQKAKQGMQRQTQHVADLVFRNFRVGYQLAREYGAGVLHVMQANETGQEEYDESAAFLAAGAIEDFGYCLGVSPDVTSRMSGSYQGDIARNIEWIGAYAVDDPSILRDQGPVLELVGSEAAKRKDFWLARVNAFRAMPGELDRDRRTPAERQCDMEITALVASFAIMGADGNTI